MRILFFVLIHFILISMAKAQSPRPEIAISSQAQHEVSAGLPILLEDLGGASFVSAEIMAAAGQTVLLEPMFAGEERNFSNLEFVRLLKEKIGGQGAMAGVNFTYFVPEKVKIKALKNHLSVPRLNAQILRSLTAKCRTCSFKIKDLRLPAIENRADLYAYELDTTSLKMAGGFLLPLRMQFENQEKTLFVTGSVQTRAQAFITSRALSMGEKIDAKDVREDEIEISFAQDALASLEDFTGRVLNKGLSMGRPIYRSDLKKEIAVTRGQMIRVLSGNELFEVSGQMLAEEAGSVGDMIKIKNLDTQKFLSGQIVERGVVRVQ